MLVYQRVLKTSLGVMRKMANTSTEPRLVFSPRFCVGFHGWHVTVNFTPPTVAKSLMIPCDILWPFGGIMLHHAHIMPTSSYSPYSWQSKDTITGWRLSQPLWKIWVRQLGWWHSQSMESRKIPWFQTTNQQRLSPKLARPAQILPTGWLVRSQSIVKPP